MAFSGDSTKLAVAQSSVVLVYKLGAQWGEKKSICNKFEHTADVTTVAWHASQASALVFGTADGKVMLGNLRTNKFAPLLSTDSMVISLAYGLNGNGVLSGHGDGTISRCFMDDTATTDQPGKIAIHKCPPSALSWGETIIAAGNDLKVVVYDTKGRPVQTFDYTKDLEQEEFTVAETSPSGKSVVIGSFNRIRVYNYSISRRLWEEAPMKIIDNFYTVTTLSWNPDGSRLVAVRFLPVLTTDIM